MLNIGGIFESGANTFDTAVNWLMYGQEKQILDEYRQEDLERAEVLRQDQLARERWQKKFAQEKFDLETDQFNYGKYQWGEQFNLSKKQYRDQKKRQKEQDKINKQTLDYQMKEHGLDKLSTEITNAANKDADLKNTLLKYYGV